jgi:hypothetical protein
MNEKIYNHIYVLDYIYYVIGNKNKKYVIGNKNKKYKKFKK